MRRKWILIAGILLIVIGSAGIFLRTKVKPAQAGIQVDSTPQSKVFINDEEAGTTPLEKLVKPGDIALRLLPLEGEFSPWSTKVTLTQNVKTVVRRTFGPTDSQSSGEILSFEKTAGKTSSLAVVSSPDSAEVVIDGEGVGFAPIKRDLAQGKHTLKLSRPGFSDRELTVTTEPGYKLTAVVKLAEIPSEVTPSPAPSPLPSPTPKSTAKASPTPAPKAGKTPTPSPKGTLVEILDTPTGFLRVRAEPSTSATESARVTPGNKYPYLEQNKDATWFKIEYEKGKTGWVSGQYAKKVE